MKRLTVKGVTFLCRRHYYRLKIPFFGSLGSFGKNEPFILRRADPSQLKARSEGVLCRSKFAAIPDRRL